MCMVLGGCAYLTPKPKPPIVVTKVVTPDVPEECTSDDPSWVNPPKGFEPTDATARRERRNKDHYEDVTSDRAVCRAGLKASPQTKGNTNG